MMRVKTDTDLLMAAMRDGYEACRDGAVSAKEVDEWLYERTGRRTTGRRRNILLRRVFPFVKTETESWRNGHYFYGFKGIAPKAGRDKGAAGRARSKGGAGAERVRGIRAARAVAR